MTSGSKRMISFIVLILGFAIGIIVGRLNKPSFVWLFINTNILYIDNLDVLLPSSYIISGLLFSLLFKYIVQHLLEKNNIESNIIFILHNNFYSLIAHIVLCIIGMLYAGYPIGIFVSLLLYVFVGFLFIYHKSSLFNFLSVVSIPSLFISSWFIFQLADLNKIESLNISMNTINVFLTSPFIGFNYLGLQDNLFFITFIIPSVLLWVGMQLRKNIAKS
ncbi:MAG: hypothetical protein KAX49_13175 [Halanaerobiales bacterium]|nr:hypothetical protein [Halanaerobiales bacterium]